MQFRTEKNSNDQIQSSNIVPGHCRKLLIPFAKIVYSEGAFGNIFSQEVTTKYYTIEYHHCVIRQSVGLYYNPCRRVYSLNYRMHGSVHCISPTEEFTLSENHYYLFNMPDAELKIIYEPGTYDSFHINLEPKYLEAFSKKYLRLKKLLELLQNEPAGKIKFYERIFASASNIIQQIINSPNDELEMAIQQSSLANQLIVLFLRDIQSLIDPEFHQMHVSTRLLKDIKAYITTHLEEKLGVEMLAKQFMISESSFKRHFNHHFEMSIADFIREQRMKKAATLLIQNVSVQSIACLTGYGALQAFSKAFSAYYGQTPTDYRKNFDQN